MRSTGVCAAVAFAFVVGGCGAVRKPPEPDRRLNVRAQGALFESDGGYQFAVLPEPSASIVRLDVRYPVGSADDPPGKEGLAHLVEHLLFDVEIDRGGTRTSIGAELERLALAYNAHTAADETTYEVVASPTALDELMRLEVERLSVGCAGLTEAIFAREREVVLNELRMRYGANGAELDRLIREAVYPVGHPYRRSNSVESVGKLQLADVCAFLDGPYRRGKAYVIASGAVDAKRMQAAAGKHLGRAPRRNTRGATAAAPPARPNPGTVTVRAGVDAPTLLATWPLPPRSTREFRLLELAWPYIPGHLGTFATRYQWGYGTTAYVFGGTHAPVLVVAVTLTSSSKLDEGKEAVAKAAKAALREIYRTGDSRDDDVWKAQWQGSAEALVARWDSLATRNQLVGDVLQHETGGRILAGHIDELATAQPREVRDLAARWFDPARARHLLLEPSGAPSPVQASSYTEGAAAHVAQVDPALADRPLAAPVMTPAIPPERYALDNGLTVVMWPYGAAPIVHGRLLVDSGTAHAPRGKDGIADLVLADQVAADRLVYAQRTLSTQVDDLVGQLAFPLRLPGHRLSGESRHLLRTRVQRERSTGSLAYLAAFQTALYGAQHPYARAPLTEASLDRISGDDVVSWAGEHVVGANATLIIAGKFDPAVVKKHVAYNADHVGRGRDSNDEHPPATSRQAWIRGVDDEPSPTVLLEVGFVGGRGVDRDHAFRVVLEAVLDAQLAQLRAKRALGYTVSARYVPQRAGGRWHLSGPIDASRAAEGAAMLATILGDMRADPEAYRTAFVLARQKVVERLVAGATDSAEVIGRLAFLEAWEQPATYYDALARSVAAMTLADLHGFVQRELAFDKQVFGAFGNAAAVDAALAAAQAVKPVAKSGLVDPFR